MGVRERYTDQNCLADFTMEDRLLKKFCFAGVTFDVFHSEGTTPFLSERLNNVDREDEVDINQTNYYI